MRIGVDLDGVVADFTHGWTSIDKRVGDREFLERELREGGF